MGPGERIPVLDSLRGAAILMVFAYHAFFWSGLRTDWWLARVVSLATRPGWLGVDLFFVLSGFLITGRLLDRRHFAARDYYVWFYTRRALRILPLYYAMLVLVGSAMWWAGETSLSFLAASALFMPNIAMLAGMWTTGPLAVLWSLGIEEQVYLVWPFIVRSLTARRLAWFFVALGVAEPLLRYATFSTGLMREGISMATWLRLDGFAWGGLLAIVVRDVRDRSFTEQAARRTRCSAPSPQRSASRRCARRWGISRGGPASEPRYSWPAPTCCLPESWRSRCAARCRRSARPSVLSYFGRISYCLYLVHLFAFWCFDRIAGVHLPMALGPIAVRAIIVLAVSTAIAELSWRYLEAPILGVGSRFQFLPPVLRPVAVSENDSRHPRSI